ncbi:MAG: 16S rRNA (cytidine(1402)-2'-O)-methyltransferase [Chloroflexota bacterium]|nr:16S rRNA (cytidine(1402)-2'-O)-methyltransferase [Chloroflexota bacterium]
MSGGRRPSAGTLVLVATPIGNLGDLSPRAVETLAAADVIACEDTRRVRQLLTHAGIPTRNRLVAVNDHNEASHVRFVLERLDMGNTVAVVSDAGMPAISDPGERLVTAAAAAGHEVTVVPGPSAALTALVLSGLPTGRFCFEGFLPRKGKARTERLQALATEPRTIVLFEAPHRVRETLDDLVNTLGPLRRVALARELTKRFEEVWRGTLQGAASHADEAEPRGEFVLVIDGAPSDPSPSAETVERALRALMGTGVDKRSAIAQVARELDVPKRDVYDLAVKLGRV